MGQTRMRKGFKLRLPWRGASTPVSAKSKVARGNGDFGAVDETSSEGSSEGSRDQDLTQTAETATARKDWATAVSLWKEVLRTQGNEAPVHAIKQMAYALREHGDHDEAEAVTRRGLERHRASAPLLRELARLAMVRENWAEAARVWRQVLSTPFGLSSSVAYAGLIRSLRNSGNVEGAEIALQQAQKQFPHDVRVLTEQAVLENFAEPSREKSVARSHSAEGAVEVVVCVHNAFEETRACLEALAARTSAGQFLTVVDDASEPEVRALLEEYVALANGRRLLFNETNQGYTKSANRGLKAARADWVVLLNSDTLVTEGWLNGLLECAASDSKLRAVGPLSNEATFQSLPWAEGQTPEAETLERLAKRVRALSSVAYPKVPMLNGFCLMLHKPTLNEVGYLDETSFPRGYGEENDLCLRLVSAGYKLAIADDVYVYHSKSASFGCEVREELRGNAVRTLKTLWPGYSYDYISQSVQEIPALKQLKQAISA